MVGVRQLIDIRCPARVFNRNTALLSQLCASRSRCGVIEILGFCEIELTSAARLRGSGNTNETDAKRQRVRDNARQVESAAFANRPPVTMKTASVPALPATAVSGIDLTEAGRAGDTRSATRLCAR